MKPTFFATAAEFRRWLKSNHVAAEELLVGFHKKASGKPSITWPESVDEALCFGWIDGVRHSLGKTSYTIRFTPRKLGSVWSAVNVRRAEELSRSGRMQAAGREAFESGKRSDYSYEQRKAIKLPKEYESQFTSNRRAWAFFQTQAPWYRRTATFWVMSAKKIETRQRRLAILIRDSGANQLVAPLRRPTPGGRG